MKALLLILLLTITKMSFSQSDTSLLTLKIKLIFADPPTPPCGTNAWAITHKAIILESKMVNLKPKDTLLLIQTCPELFKIGYLEEGRSYKVKISKTSAATFDYTVVSQFLKENYPKYWIREIETIKK